MEIGSPGGGTWEYSSTCSAVRVLQGYMRWGWGSSGRTPIPHPYPEPCLSYNGGVQHKEGLFNAT